MNNYNVNNDSNGCENNEKMLQQVKIPVPFPFSESQVNRNDVKIPVLQSVVVSNRNNTLNNIN